MAKGWIIILEGQGPLYKERHPSALVHETYDDARAAWDRGGQVDNPLQINPVVWDDTQAAYPWPP
jgi:hypothetical protein